jgi:hypothetical protein
VKKLFFLFLFLFSIFSFFTGKIYAEDAFPAPGRIDCDPSKTEDPEYSSGRPYQASPCGDRPITYWCGNTVVVNLGNVSCPYRPGITSCTPNITHYEQKIAINLTGVELPILGNTELGGNSQGGNQMDEGTKVNNYLAWYLGGTNANAEQGPGSESMSVNFAGPVKKLLPGVIQDAARVRAIDLAFTSTTSTDEETQETKEEMESHNQIVVCAKQGEGGFLGWIKDLFNVGVSRPVPCYTEEGSMTATEAVNAGISAGAVGPAIGGKAQGDVMRLGDWNGELSIANAAGNALVSGALNFFELVFPFVSTSALQESIGDHYNFRKPPLPWDDGTGEPFASDVLYQKAYYEWRGQTCVILPVMNRLACFENFLVPNKYADLFPYVPLVNTSDKKGSQMLTGTGFRAPRAEIVSSTYVIQHNPALWVPHTAETYELSELLKTTYKSGLAKDAMMSPEEALAQGIPPSVFQQANVRSEIPADVENNRACRVIDSRSNPGDDTTFENPESILEVDVEYDIGEIQCDTPKEVCRTIRGDNPNTAQVESSYEKCELDADCSSDIYALLPAVSKTPYADEIWNNTVAAEDSAFRRIYPKTGVDSPVSCIADIPAESKATYTVNDASDKDVSLWKVEGPGVEPEVFKGDGASSDSIDAKLYYPHFGGVLEYFLKGIQTALRPKDLGEGNVLSSQYCTNIKCGELPETLPEAKGSCKLGSTSSRVGKIPDALKDLVSSAAEAFKVPPNLIIGVLFGEGVFNTDAAGNYTKYNWTDQNVQNWASCQPLPNCGGPESSIVSFSANWEKLSKLTLPELQKIDPSKKEADPCNLLDAVYAVGAHLRGGAGGSPALTGKSCLGITMTSTIPTSCDWNDSMYETAIRVWEFGTQWGNTSNGFLTCATDTNSCATGGIAAQCDTDSLSSTDTCDNSPAANSHNSCVYEVGHGR